MTRLLLRDLVLGLDHIGVCVAAADDASSLWSELLGLPLAHREVVASQSTEAVFFDFQGQRTTLELVCPLPGNLGLRKFLEKRGDALHHVAFAVSDIALALDRLAAAHVALIDRHARAGARGHRVAFLHPKAASGTLVELVERKNG